MKKQRLSSQKQTQIHSNLFKGSVTEVLFGKELYEYEQAIHSLEEIENQLTAYERTKESLEQEKLEVENQIKSLERQTSTVDVEIELTLAKQKLFLITKDYQRVEERLFEEILPLMEQKEERQTWLDRKQKTIPSYVWKEYEKMKEVVENPVAKVKHQVCTGCFMALSEDNVRSWRLGKGLVKCHTCGRILA